MSKHIIYSHIGDICISDAKGLIHRPLYMLAHSYLNGCAPNNKWFHLQVFHTGLLRCRTPKNIASCHLLKGIIGIYTK